MGQSGTREPVRVAARRRAPGPWTEFASTPARLRAYLVLVAVAAVSLPIALTGPVRTPHAPEWLTGAVLVGVSVLNVELSRWLSGGLARTHQPHKALSAWAFASAMLLPTAWLLVIVPLTYSHARWRGIRVPMWKWLGSGCFLVLCGLAAATVRQQVLGNSADWASGDGHRGFLTMLAAVAVFLALEAMLFAGSAYLNAPEDEVWLRAMLASPTFYATEVGVLFLGGLFSMVWSAGTWFSLLFLPVYVLVQHVVLLAPLRERAAVAAELADKNAELAGLNSALAGTNAELDEMNQFKTDLISMLGHEIGNPLTSVVGFTQIASEAAASADCTAARDALAVVDRNAEKVRAVLDEIILLVANDRGVLVAHPQPVDVEPHLRTAVAELPVEQRPLVDCAGDLEALVQATHLDQILANLLTNARKYGGGATHVTASRNRSGQVEVAVCDQGAGVPEAFAGQLFQRYRRDPMTAAKVPGTGIGLFISRELARANGGDLLLDTATTAGSRFVLWLPAAAHR